jgi:hypothetical protein
MFQGGLPRPEGAKVSPFSSLGVLLSRIEPEAAGLELRDHGEILPLGVMLRLTSRIDFGSPPSHVAGK